MANYEVKKGEEGYVHLEIQRKEFDPKTGKPLFKPYNHVVTPREFENFLNHPAGMTINKIHHLPEGMEIPKKKIKEGKKVKEVPYPAMENVEVPSLIGGDDPVATRTKALKKLTVAELDEILEGLELPIEGNKGDKVEAILEAEFPEEEPED